MKVIIFGATGTVGIELVKQALAEGHEVTAFARNKEKLKEIISPNLHVFEGNVFDETAVENAVSGHDAVSVVLGSGKSRESVVRSRGTKNVIEAMKKTGVTRLFCQTTLGAGESSGNLNFFWKHIMFGWFLKKVFLDHELQEKYVRESGLDWTIIRPGAFTDGPLTGKYKTGFSNRDRNIKLKISRKDIAHFIVGQFKKSNLHKAVSLSY